MESSLNTPSGGRWLFAFVASVAVHAVVLGLLLAPGCGGGGSSPSDTDDVPETVEKIDDAPTVTEEQRSYDPAAVLSPDSMSEPRSAARPSTPSAARPSNPPAARPASQPTARPTAAPSTDAVPAVYVVKQGDNLTKIARQFGTTAEAIAKANGKSVNAMNKLWVGQKIKLR